MADIIKVNQTFKNALDKSVSAQSKIDYKNVISLCPLWAYQNGGADMITNTVVLPVSPSEIMFDNECDISTVKLMNYGELPVSTVRKLATWSLTSVFLNQFERKDSYYQNENGGLVGIKNRYWFDYSNENGQSDWDVYDGYARRLYEWQVNQTPLVFIYKTWGSYYYCQIKSFKFGNKDSTGHVYYDLSFQEYKRYTKLETDGAYTDYGDVYYPGEGETLLTIAQKIFGNSNYFVYLMKINGLTNPTNIVAGQEIKLK